MTLLWGSHFEAQARQNLRQALSRLRRILGEGTLVTNGEAVSLRPGTLVCDVAQFETLLSQANRDALNAAVGLYRDCLLTDIAIPEEAWTEWLGVQRQRLQSLALDAMVRLAEQEFHSGRHEQALRAASRAIEVSSLREDAHRLVMRVLAAGGRRADALKHYEEFAALLKRELAVEPDPTTRAISAELRQSQAARPASEARPGPASETSATLLPLPDRPSIAVLPFANMSGDKEQEYFSDGLAEEIINALVKVPGLKVIARTSAFAFKGQNTDIRKIAETLGVTTVLEGSVRRSGNRIRVTAQLITAADGSHLWSERYDRELADVFAVQDEISAAISEALQVKLSPQAAAKPRYTPKLPAYEALLKAKHFHWKVTAESMEQAKGFYEQAIELDPQYALAQATYADYLFGRTTVGMSRLRDIAPVARALARRALELEPSLPEAHNVLGCLAAYLDYNWKEAESECLLSTASDAASAHCYFGFGFCLHLAGRGREAVKQLEQAVQRDPLQTTIRTWLGITLSTLGRDAEAEEQFRQTMHLDANFFWAYVFLAEFYAARGRFAEALPIAEKAFTLTPWYPSSVGIYAGLLARLGQPDRGQELIQKLGSGETFGASTGRAIFHTCCGEMDLAADWCEKAIAERDPQGSQTLQTPLFEPLRASPRWPKLAALMNLQAEAS